MNKVFCTGTGVFTPLGNTPDELFDAVREGRSAFRLHEGWPEPYYASLFERSTFSGPSFFDYIALQAAREASKGVDLSSPRVGLVLSTIKGEIEKLGKADVSLAASARRLADSLGVQTPPVVVSNACISGLAALVQGMRMIRSGAYDHVLVVGAELQSRFVVTGFQSLKALSQRPCRPFDAAREGLNLGEAAAAMLLSRHSGASALSGQGEESAWELVSGAIRNDANHISGPSRTGEGSYNALRCVMEGVKPEELAFVNVHGTATPYNDQMEAVALSRAGLETVPVNALKGVFGHTMGAAGILESLVSMLACERGVVLPTRGFSTMGVEPAVCVSARERKTDKKAFVKLLSGFGGVNGALLFRKGGAA